MSYTVTFESNHVIEETLKVKKGKVTTEIEAKPVTDYNFVEWYLNDTVYDFSTPVTEDITLVAKWKLKKYTIVFKDEDGTVLRQETLDAQTTISAPIAPEKASDDDYDYSFSGWDVEFNKATSDMIITVRYTKIESPKCTVTFYNGEELVKEVKVKVNEKVAKPTIDTSTDDQLYEWYKESTCENPWLFEINNVTTNTKLYAKKVSKNLSYELDSPGNSYTLTGIGTCTDTDIVIPSTYNGKPIIYIDEDAFYNCSSLTSIEIPSSIKNIGQNTFESCSSLTNITIPQSVKTIRY